MYMPHKQRIMQRLSSSLFCTSHRTLPPLTLSGSHSLHLSSRQNAVALPITATGPPPSTPVSAISEQIVRRQRRAELLRHGQSLRADQTMSEDRLKKRFWKDVNVKTDSGMFSLLIIIHTDIHTHTNHAQILSLSLTLFFFKIEGTHTIHLDTRPVRNPSTKRPLPIPASKPHLATAIALEWDLLTSAKDTLQSHLLPLTSLASRAHDIILEESHPSGPSESKTRTEIVSSLLNYLNTDTLLCWAPEHSSHDEHLHIELSSSSKSNHNNSSSSKEKGNATTPPSLRTLQQRTAQPILTFLTTNLWPAISLHPTLSPYSILPTDQPHETQAIIRSWMLTLSPWDLAGLERATLAGKSLLVGARLVVEWGQGFEGIRQNGGQRFGIEDAVEACSVELRWQTGNWGEVEDTHDVEREDLRRQFGGVVVLVGGGEKWTD